MSNELLIACAVKGTASLIAAGLVAMALRRASAAARHLVWAVAFAALLLLPVLSLAVPRWTVAAPQSAVRLASPAQAVTVSKAAPAGFDWLVLIWATGATLALARFAAGTARIWLITRRARPITIAGAGSAVRVLDAGRGAMPLAWRLLRPVILLPTHAAEWPPARLRAGLLHERPPTA